MGSSDFDRFMGFGIGLLREQFGHEVEQCPDGGLPGGGEALAGEAVEDVGDGVDVDVGPGLLGGGEQAERAHGGHDVHHRQSAQTPSE